MDDIKYLKDIESFHLYYVESIGSTNTFLKDNFSKYPNNSTHIEMFLQEI